LGRAVQVPLGIDATRHLVQREERQHGQGLSSTSDITPNETLSEAAGDLRVAGLQLGHRFVKEIEFELYPRRLPKKNKAALAVLEFLLLGICGVDRCYMGQTCLGVIKGMSLGGLLVWFIIDWLTIIVLDLTWAKEIHAVGYNAVFTDGVGGAFWVTVVALALTLFAFAIRRFHKTDEDDNALQDDYTLFDKEGSGYVTKLALKKVLWEYDVVITDEEVNELFKLLDPESSGKISVRELLKTLGK